MKRVLICIFFKSNIYKQQIKHSFLFLPFFCLSNNTLGLVWNLLEFLKYFIFGVILVLSCMLISLSLFNFFFFLSYTYKSYLLFNSYLQLIFIAIFMNCNIYQIMRVWLVYFFFLWFPNQSLMPSWCMGFDWGWNAETLWLWLDNVLKKS